MAPPSPVSEIIDIIASKNKIKRAMWCREALQRVLADTPMLLNGEVVSLEAFEVLENQLELILIQRTGMFGFEWGEF